MQNSSPLNRASDASPSGNAWGFLLDILLYVTVMFAVRELYFPQVGFLANGLFWSCTTLVVAMWRMRARGVTWKDLGLRRPDHFGKTLGVTALILAATLAALIGFNILLEFLPNSLAEDTSEASAGVRFGNLQGNVSQLLLILPAVLLESMLEELLDRGFLLSWIEKALSSTAFATVVAVVLQAVLFGFRHSYDLSERSITVGLIGLVMGIAYVAFGRNLWPLILAHCLLNGGSMVGRVLE